MKTPTKGELTRARVIREARILITARGFKNTTINEIIQATGVKKGAMYFHFSSKDELGLAVLTDARDEFFAFLDQAVAGDSPMERLNAMMAALLRQQENTHFVGGCLFGNTALEMSDSHEEFARIIQAVFVHWIDLLTEIILRGQEDGTITSALPARSLAKTVVAVVEGGIMMARASKKTSDFTDCTRTVNALLTT